MTVGEISVRGIMQSRGALVAMVQGPDNKTYIVHQGDKLLDGTIKSDHAAGARRRSGSQRSAVARQAAGSSQAAAIARGRQGMTVNRGLALFLTVAAAGALVQRVRRRPAPPPTRRG